MSGTLFVVATPIGNLDDITLRALRVLRESNAIAAEDTRRTARLLSHHGIRTPTISFHEHNWRGRLPGLVARLGVGQRLALVSDAGTPGVSDPGVELVQACIHEGITVDPIPGPSAPLTAVIASGFPVIPLTVLGFAPSRSKDRIRWLTALSLVPNTVSFFETPHRIGATLRDLGSIIGDRPISVARELTKMHQEFLRGTAAAILPRVTAPRGEFTVVVGPTNDRQTSLDTKNLEVSHDFGRMTDLVGLGGRKAAAAVARKLGQSTNSVYSAIERAKKSAL